MIRRRICLLVVAVLLQAGAARAGGFEYGTDNGAEAVARGGASTAIPGLHSMYTNLAGIADTERVTVYLSANLSFRHVWFQRAGGFDPVEDQSVPFPGPMIASAIRLTDTLVLGLGVFGPAAVGVATVDQGTLDDPSPARYLLTDMQLAWVWPTIALAFRAPSHPALRVAVAFQPAFAYVYLRTFAGTVAVDHPVTDVVAEFAAWDPFVPAFQLGVMYRVGSRVELGLGARITDRVMAEGDAVPVESPFDGEGIRNPPSRAHLDVPVPFMVARAGVRYRHPRRAAAADAEDPPELEGPPHRSELFDIELDLIYKTASDLESLTLTLDEPAHTETMGDIALDPLTIPHRWNDSFSVRLGGSVNLLGGDLTLSAGVWWESATVPVAYTHFDITTWMSVGVGGGVTYRVQWFEVAVAYQHIFMPDRHVSLEEGGVMPLRASAASSSFDGPPANAGDWRGSQDLLSISLAARL